MIQQDLKRAWANAALSEIQSDPRHYKRWAMDAGNLVTFIENKLDDLFNKEVGLGRFNDDYVEARIENKLEAVIANEGDDMTRTKAMAEALKVSYGTGFEMPEISRRQTGRSGLSPR